MAWRGAQYTITATAANLTSILGLTANQPSNSIKEVVIKNATGAANALYVGPSTVANTPADARVELAANQAWSAGPHDGYYLNTDMIYLVGTANAANIAFISVVM